jgi:hypothetical protein
LQAPKHFKIDRNFAPIYVPNTLFTFAPSNQVVKEILSTGGAFKHIPIDRTGEGYLNPDEFHKALLERCV